LRCAENTKGRSLGGMFKKITPGMSLLCHASTVFASRFSVARPPLQFPVQRHEAQQRTPGMVTAPAN
jgi:hypothetical protein